MKRGRCKFLGPLTPGKGKARPCANPLVGGTCELLGSCQTCPHWVAPDGGAPPVVTNREDPPDAAPAEECVFRGRAPTADERERHRLGPGKKWALCTLPSLPLGPFVCPCAGCGPKCPGYKE